MPSNQTNLEEEKEESLNVYFRPYSKDEIEVYIDTCPYPMGTLPKDTPEACLELIKDFLKRGYYFGLSQGEKNHQDKLREVFGFDTLTRFPI